MPELPEVETVMRGLEPVMQDRVISDVWCGEKGLRIPFPEGLSKRLKGTTINRLARRAKYILLHMSNGCILVLHLGMSGRVRILAPEVMDTEEAHDHFKMTLETGHRIILNDARRFGMVFDVSANDFAGHKAFSHLGPEPLSADFSGRYLYQRLKKKTAPIKTAIMDQRLVVGVGNIYACEALFRSNISPRQMAEKIQMTQADVLARSIKEVLRDAIRAGGSTLKDHRLPDGEFGYFQQNLSVYGRAGEQCVRAECSAKAVERIIQAGRSTFYCPECQSQDGK